MEKKPREVERQLLARKPTFALHKVISAGSGGQVSCWLKTVYYTAQRYFS
jgi:hypothetical protein